MKKFLKLFSVLMVLNIILSFSGCSKNKNTKDDKVTSFSENNVDLKGRTVTIGVPSEWYIPQEDDSNYNQYWSEYMKHVNKVRLAREKEAEEKFNCNIEWKVVNRNTILSDLQSGNNIPDILVFGSSSGLLDLISENLILPLDDYIDFDSGLYSNSVQKSTLWQGKHYGISSDFMHTGQVMTYNKTMIQNAGLTDPYELMKTDQWTWESFLDMLKQLTVKDESNPSNTVWGMVDSDFRTVYINFIYSNGGDFIGENNGKFELMIDSPETLEAINFVTDLYENYQVLFNNLGSGNNRRQGADIFRSGKAAFYGGNITNTRSNNESNYPQFETGIVAYPKGPSASGYTAYHDAGSNIFCIPATTKQPEKIANVLYCLLSIYDSTKSDYIDYEKEFLSEASEEQIEINKTLSENLVYSWFLGDEKYSTPLNDILTGILTDKKSVEESINSQKELLDTLLNTLNQKLSQR